MVALIAIVLVRPAAMLLSLLRTPLPPSERLTAAWFGPKGFASVVYGLLALPIRNPRSPRWSSTWWRSRSQCRSCCTRPPTCRWRRCCTSNLRTICPPGDPTSTPRLPNHRHRRRRDRTRTGRNRRSVSTCARNRWPRSFRWWIGFECAGSSQTDGRTEITGAGRDRAQRQTDAILPASQVVQFLVPGYVQDDPSLARVMNESMADRAARQAGQQAGPRPAAERAPRAAGGEPRRHDHRGRRDHGPAALPAGRGDEGKTVDRRDQRVPAAGAGAASRS